MRAGIHHLVRLRGGKHLVLAVEPLQAPDSILVVLVDADGNVIPPRGEAAECAASDFEHQFLRAAGLMARRASAVMP